MNCVSIIRDLMKCIQSEKYKLQVTKDAIVNIHFRFTRISVKLLIVNYTEIVREALSNILEGIIGK